MNINKSYISTENTYAKNNPQYIVVHNTDNFKAGANALAHAKAQHTRQNWCATLWPRPGFRQIGCSSITMSAGRIARARFVRITTGTDLRN